MIRCMSPEAIKGRFQASYVMRFTKTRERYPKRGRDGKESLYGREVVKGLQIKTLRSEYSGF